MRDLAQYKSYKDKGVMMAARSLIALYRASNPELLHKKDRGRPTEALEELRSKRYGETVAKDYLPGAEELDVDGDGLDGDADTDEANSEGWEDVDQSNDDLTDDENSGEDELTDNDITVCILASNRFAPHFSFAQISAPPLQSRMLRVGFG